MTGKSWGKRGENRGKTHGQLMEKYGKMERVWKNHGTLSGNDGNTQENGENGLGKLVGNCEKNGDKHWENDGQHWEGGETLGKQICENDKTLFFIQQQLFYHTL